MSSTEKHVYIGIVVFLLVVVIAYTIFMFEMYKQQKFIFTPYVPPTPSEPYFYPLGNVTPLTAEEIEQRNKIINDSINATPSF